MRKKVFIALLLAAFWLTSGDASFTAGFSIVRWTADRQEMLDGYYIVMYVRNNTEYDLEFASLIASFYDKGGRLVARADTLPVTHFLSGSTRKVESWVDDLSLDLDTASVRIDEDWSY